MEVVSNRDYEFDQAPDALWEVLTRVGEYGSWWPWLERFDGEELASGQRWHCVVRPPLPYRVRFVVEIEDASPPTTVAATVSGDIAGTARIDVTPARSGGSSVRLQADLRPSNPALQLLARFARPLVRFGHDWVIDSGARQFGEHVARATAPPPPQQGQKRMR